MALTPPTRAEKIMSVNIAILKLMPPLSIENTTNVIIEYAIPVSIPFSSRLSFDALFSIVIATKMLSILIIWSIKDIVPEPRSTNFSTNANNNTNNIDTTTPIKLAFNILTIVVRLILFIFSFIYSSIIPYEKKD